MQENRQYEKEYKIEAVKLAKEIGTKRASVELGIPYNTLSGWIRKTKNGEIDLGIGSSEPGEAMSLAAEVQMLRKQNKEQQKEIKRLQELNEFLEEASAFFAASRQRLEK